MKMEGFTEKGFKRKLAVQALFGKIYYLAEVMNVETFTHTRDNLLSLSTYPLI